MQQHRNAPQPAQLPFKVAVHQESCYKTNINVRKSTPGFVVPKLSLVLYIVAIRLGLLSCFAGH